MPRNLSASRTIEAPADRIWQRLTDAEGYPSANPSMVSLRGPIAAGASIELVSAVNPKRTFRLKVSDLEPPRRMTWSSGMPLGLLRAERTFSLQPLGDERTAFSMEETYSGALASPIVKSIPDLTPSFEQFADGLEEAAERGQG